jgi:hypothetical protein
MSPSRNLLLPPALALLAAAPLAAQVKIHLEPASLLPGQSAVLQACLDGSWWQPDWTWSLAEPDTGRVHRGADGLWRYLAAEDFLLAPQGPAHAAFDDQGHCLVAFVTGRGSGVAELSLGGVLPPQAPAGESKAAPPSTE